MKKGAWFHYGASSTFIFTPLNKQGGWHQQTKVALLAKSCAFLYTSQSVPTGKDTPCLRAHLSHRTQGPYGTRCQSKVNVITGATLRRSSCSTLKLPYRLKSIKRTTMSAERRQDIHKRVGARGACFESSLWQNLEKTKVQENKHSATLFMPQPTLRHTSLRLCQTPRRVNRWNYDNAGKRRAPSSWQMPL